MDKVVYFVNVNSELLSIHDVRERGLKPRLEGVDGIGVSRFNDDSVLFFTMFIAVLSVFLRTRIISFSVGTLGRRLVVFMFLFDFPCLLFSASDPSKLSGGIFFNRIGLTSATFVSTLTTTSSLSLPLLYTFAVTDLCSNAVTSVATLSLSAEPVFAGAVPFYGTLLAFAAFAILCEIVGT